MRPETLQRYSAPVPRYTSYPTAPHFSPRIGPEQYAGWLRALPADDRISLYLHIPYCDALCWYCGCTTKATRRYEPVVEYLKALEAEIEKVASLVPPTVEVSHIHWGGGSPSILEAADVLRLGNRLRQAFRVSGSAEFAVEVDPRHLPEARISALASIGVNRVSIGVQDFDARVQMAINRIQSYETTKLTVDALRAYGIRGVNIDLVYGLPHQTRDSVDATIAKVLALRPDRIALFGYAHLPQRFSHQRLIEDQSLPDAKERFAQVNRASSRLAAGGYERVGLDHFALPTDELAAGHVHRNFQGYTTDDARTLIGLGTSAIGHLPQGFVQNTPATAEYMRRVTAGELATVRGHELSTDDRIRSLVIERLMCDLAFPEKELRERFGADADAVIEEAQALTEADTDGLVEPGRPGEGFSVTEKGRLFVRSICSVFDAYLETGAARHAAGV